MTFSRTRGASSLLGSLPFVTSLVAAACLAAAPLSGQDPPAESAPSAGDSRTTPITIPRIAGPIELDGIVDEAAWDEVEPFPITVFSPAYGAPPTETTEVRVAHDDEFLYVSGRLYDSEPEAVRTNTFYRDRYSGDDGLAVIFDSYNDYETAVWFVTNPAGNRIDRTVFNDAQIVPRAGMPSNSDWNSYWDVVTSQSDEGWFAEFRIPFSTLGFQVQGDEVTMGFIFYRMIARKNERHTFPDLDPRWGGIAFAKPSQAQRVVLRGVQQSTPVYLTPYALGGLQQTPRLTDGPAGPESAWETDSGGVPRGRTRHQVCPYVESGAERHREYRLRPGGGGQRPGQPRTLPVVRPPRSASSFRSAPRPSTSTPAAPSTASSTAGRSASPMTTSSGSTGACARWDASAAPTTGSSTCRPPGTASARPRTWACCGCASRC